MRMDMAEILVVDDDSVLAEMLVEQLGRKGHRAISAPDLASGVRTAREGDFDVVFLDVQLPDGNGLEKIALFADAPSAPEIIIMTGHGDMDGARKAIQCGAWSYLEKPHVLRNLLLPLTRALQYREEKKKITVRPVALKRDHIIGKAPCLASCLDQVAQAAMTDASVFVTGETGTGKELFARAIHENSPRARKGFVVVDCAALPESLIESILFGHAKGAFTGADRAMRGLIDMADGGTLFLDEVGEMPEVIQKKFLRVLQERQYRAVGGAEEVRSDFRLLSATNRDLDREVERGRFRGDLLYRLRATTIVLPPLRDRKEDIKSLTLAFLARLCNRHKIENKVVTEEFLEHLIAYDWPGNVRELQHALEHVFAGTVHHSTLYAFHLPEHFRVRKTVEGMQGGKATPWRVSSYGVKAPPEPWKAFKTRMEREYLEILLGSASGSIPEACALSGLSRARLYQLIRQHGVSFQAAEPE
jgi:two-component system NtrC family response regulator